jgi:(p)ppGpp synthase/HD superfamily hydrolase
MATLERAIQIAAQAHAGQTNKADEPYVRHPLRVMDHVEGEPARIVAVLHDVLEDCPAWTADRLRVEGFSEGVLEALLAVTRREGEDYFDFVRRAAANPIGRRVKLADLADNIAMTRIPQPADRDAQRLARYERAVAIIKAMAAPG